MIIKPGIIKIILISILVLTSLSIFFLWQNNGVKITNYIYSNSKLPMGFEGYKILQISDLHNKDFKGRLSEKIREINPNIIVITGDLIDRRSTKIEVALEFTKDLVKVAPTYYISGNHEQLSGRYDEVKRELEKIDVRIMDGSYTVLSEKGHRIGLMGIPDPTITQSEETYLYSDNRAYIKNSLEVLLEDVDTDFNILLSHRPELFGSYRDMGIDLVFSGHAHGGQIRIPFIGGLFAPNQGFFPQYTSGIHREAETSMVVSRGLGNSIFPLRVFNRPELVVVTFQRS